MPNDTRLGDRATRSHTDATSTERRKNKRHELRWPATLVFDPRMTRPDTQSSTYDVSACGASIISLRGDLDGEVVGLLLRPKLDDPKARPILLSVLARVVSSVAVATRGRRIYRYGLSFVRPLEEVEHLASEFEDCAMSESATVPALQ